MSASGFLLDVVTENRPGILARVVVELARSGLVILRQETEELDSARQTISFQIAPGGEPSADLKERIESVPGVESMGRLAQARPSDQVLQELLRDAHYEIVNKKNVDTVATVVRFEPTLDTETRNACLISLGRNIGHRIYKERYALGSPLDLGAATGRIIVPELKEFADVRTPGGNRVELVGCPFCLDRDSEPSCLFVVGLARGLLELAPTTSTVQVTETACARERSGDGCVFALTLA